MRNLTLFTFILTLLSTLSWAEETSFIPDLTAPKVIKFAEKNAEKRATNRTQAALELFFTLPHKVLPISIFERAKDYSDKKITARDTNSFTTITWKGSPDGYPITVKMTVLDKTKKNEAQVKVIYTWDNPGLIAATHSYTYELIRKKTGWEVTRTD